MSTGPRPQAAQVNQSSAEQDASYSALFYLFQEVSKLASPTHNSFLDTNPPSKWLNNTSRQDHFIVTKEEDAHSFRPCQHSLSHMSAYNQVNSVKEESHSRKFTISAEPLHERSSPWKVLSLINLQCERLMHRRHIDDPDQSSLSSTINLPKGHQTAKSLPAETDVTEAGCVRPVEDVIGDLTQGKKLRLCCVEVSKMDFSVKSQTPEKADAVLPELVEENAAACSQYQHRDKREVSFNDGRQFVWNLECKTETFSTKRDTLNAPFCENALQQTRSQNTKLTFESDEDSSVALTIPPLTLDYNANIALTAEPPCDMQLPSSSSILSSSLVFSTSECDSLPKQDNKITGPKPECTQEESPPLSAQLKSYNLSPATSKEESKKVHEEEISPSLTQQWRTKTPRKQPHPSRSVDIQDPDLQGVTFRMDTEVDDSREQCRLLITSKYSKELCKSARKPRLRTRSQKSLRTSSSEEESDPTASVSKGKVCASCCTRKTPMWRDAEDGTPLCNACGIRYKKYRVRCVNCWHIPRKEGNSNSCCLKCGNFVKLASAQRKHTT